MHNVLEVKAIVYADVVGDVIMGSNLVLRSLV